MRMIPRRLRRLDRRDLVMLVVGVLITLAGFGLYRLYSNHKSAIPYQTAGVNSPWIPSTVKHWQTPIDAMSKKYDVDPNFVAIIMTMESGGYAKADSGEAEGLMQITPATAKQIASTYLKKPVKSYNLSDPDTNIEFGTAYLAYLRKTFESPSQGPSWDDTAELVAASYNGGPGAAVSIEQGQGLTNDQTLIYSRDARNMWRERYAHSSPTYNNWLERGGSQLIDAAKKAGQ